MSRRVRISGSPCFAAIAFYALLLGWSPPSRAEQSPCKTVTAAQREYNVCQFDLEHYAVKLFWRGKDGEPYGTLDALIKSFDRSDAKPVFAMNAGMYREDLSPVGLYVQDGIQLKAANTARGPGNFHLKPNGVFFIKGAEAGVLDTASYLRRDPKPEFATQSGPMLVLEGRLHPKFTPRGDSRKIRNGVGVRDGRTVVFALSSDGVTFTEFANLFRDTLGCRNALFLDGTISSMYAPSIGKEASLFPLPAGPLVAAFRRSQ
jgi:uncharacterized protein YigE (DUF2233 family)